MSKVNWCTILGWNEDVLEEFRLAGYAYIRQGKYKIAVNFFEALEVLDPESAYDAQTLGAVYLELGEAEKALKCFDRALKIEGDHTPTLLNLAKTFFILGRKEEGLRLAGILKNEPIPAIANMARALILAHS